MLSKIKYSPYYYLNSRKLNLSDFGLKINNKIPGEKVFSIAKNENMQQNVNWLLWMERDTQMTMLINIMHK